MQMRWFQHIRLTFSRNLALVRRASRLSFLARQWWVVGLAVALVLLAVFALSFGVLDRQPRYRSGSTLMFPYPEIDQQLLRRILSQTSQEWAESDSLLPWRPRTVYPKGTAVTGPDGLQVFYTVGGGTSGSGAVSWAVDGPSFRDSPNRLDHSAQLDNVVYRRMGVSVDPDRSVNPLDGAITADYLVEDGASSSHAVYQQSSFTAGEWSYGVHAKAGQRTRLYLALRAGETAAGQAGALFDLEAGEVVFSEPGVQASVHRQVSWPAGWYLCVITRSVPAASGFAGVFLCDGDGALDYQGTAYTATGLAAQAVSLTLDAGASAITGFYTGAQIRITEGRGAGQTRTISDYDGSTKVATISAPWAIVPDTTSRFTIESGLYLFGQMLNEGGRLLPYEATANPATWRGVGDSKTLAALLPKAEAYDKSRAKANTVDLRQVVGSVSRRLESSRPESHLLQAAQVTSSSSNTAAVRIEAVGGSAKEAAMIANAFAWQFVLAQQAAASLALASTKKEIQNELAAIVASGGTLYATLPLQHQYLTVARLSPSNLAFRILETAAPPTRPFLPRPLGPQIGLAVLAGLALGVGLALVRDRVFGHRTNPPTLTSPPPDE